MVVGLGLGDGSEFYLMLQLAKASGLSQAGCRVNKRFVVVKQLISRVSVASLGVYGNSINIWSASI